MDFPPRRGVPTLAQPYGDIMSTVEIVVIIVAAFVVGFSVGRVFGLQRKVS